MKYFLTNSTTYLKPPLLRNGIKISPIVFSKYICGERTYKLSEKVAGQEATLIASVLPEPESLFELLAAVELLKTNGVKKLRVSVPYMAYARQDRPTTKGEGSLGILVAELLKECGAESRRFLEPHSHLIVGVLEKSQIVSAAPLFADYFKSKEIEIVIAPDKGARERADRLAKLMKIAETGFVEKSRPRAGVAMAKKLHGAVKNKNVLIFDDMVDTGNTLIQAVKILKKYGAKKISIAATHGIFSKNARERLVKLPIEEIVVTNSLPQTKYKKIKTLDITPLIFDLGCKKNIFSAQSGRPDTL